MAVSSGMRDARQQPATLGVRGCCRALLVVALAGLLPCTPPPGVRSLAEAAPLGCGLELISPGVCKASGPRTIRGLVMPPLPLQPGSGGLRKPLSDRMTTMIYSLRTCGLGPVSLSGPSCNTGQTRSRMFVQLLL